MAERHKNWQGKETISLLAHYGNMHKVLGLPVKGLSRIQVVQRKNANLLCLTASHLKFLVFNIVTDMKSVCLIIGAGAGIGGHVGQRFAREGYHGFVPSVMRMGWKLLSK